MTRAVPGWSLLLTAAIAAALIGCQTDDFEPVTPPAISQNTESRVLTARTPVERRIIPETFSDGSPTWRNRFSPEKFPQLDSSDTSAEVWFSRWMAAESGRNRSCKGKWRR